MMMMMTTSLFLLLLPLLSMLQAFPLPNTAINVTTSSHSIKEDCSSPLFGSLCASINNTVRAAAPTEDCMDAIPEGFREFFSKIMTVEGVIACVSYCHPLSPFFYECNGGECSIARNKGPQCSCPSSDYYLYATTHCTGPISKIGLGTGIPAGSILVFIAVYYLVKINYI